MPGKKFPGKGGPKGSDGEYNDRYDGKALQGRTGASARFPAWKPKQWRCRRSEAEAHAPTGLSPIGDWGWTDRISVRNPVINDKILIFNIILLNINSSY